jgi:hypothetical protein
MVQSPLQKDDEQMALIQMVLQLCQGVDLLPIFRREELERVLHVGKERIAVREMLPVVDAN